MNYKNYFFLFRAWPLIVALGVALALVGGINIFWWRLNQKEELEVDYVVHSQQVIAQLNEAVNRAADLQNGQRGYAITHDKDFLVPYDNATNKLPQILTQLAEWTTDDAEEQKQMERLKKQITHHIDISRQHLDALTRGVNPMVPDVDFRNEVSSSMAAIRAIQTQMTAEENRMLNKQRADLMGTVKTVTQMNLVGGVVGVLMIFGAVAALWRENKRRRAVESALRWSHDQLEVRVMERTASLRENQARLNLAQSAARIGIFDWNLLTGNIIRSPELGAMHGLPPGRLHQPYEEWEKLIHPDDRAVVASWMEQARESGRPAEGEWRVIWPDGSVHWLFGRWQAFLDELGRPLSMIGVNLDITERKKLEQDLLEASDNEMRRIGHDLHDGVGQQLTALTLFNASIQAEAKGRIPELAEDIKKMGDGLHEIVHHIRVLSHGLAPVPFREEGLSDALQQLASDTASITKVECEFINTSPVRLDDPQQAAQLYRLAQEAVNNALKHSGARKITIALQAIPHGWQMMVSDNGKGFRQVDGVNETGLGLRAMRHRAGLMGAMFKIQSQPGQGTRIICAAQRHP